MNTQNQIPKNWQKVKLGDLGKVITGKTPPTAQKDYFEGEFPFITPTDITDFDVRYNYTTERFVSEKWASKARSLRIPKNSTCFVCIGSTIGKICLVKQDSFTNQQINSVIVNELKADPLFIYYLLKKNQKGILKEFGGGGAAKPIINKSTFENIELQVPQNVSKQRQIASVLSAFDDKIEVNNKIAKTLEEMTQALFKEWFVKFKFPDYEKAEFVESGLGRIPKEWKWGTLNDLANIRNGFAFKSTDYRNQGIPIVRTTNFTDTGSVILDDVVYLSPEMAPKYENFYLEQFDFLLVMVGASVGKWAIVPSNILPALQNQNMWDFMPKTSEYRFFNIYLLKKMIREQKGSTTGSARDFFRKDYFYSLNIFIPDSEILQKFNLLVEPIYKRLDAILGENQKLAALRDLLLPKLMRGEIKI